MRKVFDVFLRDMTNIFTNGMAIILAVGIAVLPSLYAWFNIYANMDPYGKESTQNMKIAVINEDEGCTYKLININVGDQIESNLKANDIIDWQFVPKEEGITGVKSGLYYAAIEIPNGFSNSLTSIVSSEFKRPEITYYANEKKNAIATKITDKVVQTVQTEVNESFITTVADIVNKLLQSVIASDTAGENEVTDGTSQEQGLALQISSAKESLLSVKTTLDSFRSVMDSAEKLNGVFQSADFQKLFQDIGGSVKSANDLINVTKKSVSSITSSLDSVLAETSSTLKSASETLGKADKLTLTKANYTQIDEDINKSVGKIDVSVASLQNINNNLPTKIASIDDMITKLNTVNSDIKAVSSGINSSSGSLLPVSKISEMSSLLRDTAQTIDVIRNEYNGNIKPELDKSVGSMLSVLNDVSGVLTALAADGNTDTLIKTLSGAVNSGNSLLASLSALLEKCSVQLDEFLSKAEGLTESELANTIYNLTVGNADKIGEFIACPVSVNTDKIYSIDRYGSAMAPFYSTLAIWVGAVILIAVLNPKVKKKKELGGLNYAQEYFGRALTFICFSIVQGLIISLGDLFILKMQCYHPFRFVFASILASAVFSLLMYSLAASLGDIGKAVAVILLVVQIGGSGGTFPIDVTPSFFRTINPYLPFTFVIDAMRECVCGRWAHSYELNLLKLCIFIPVAVAIGLGLGYVMRKPIKFFNKKLEETDLL